VRVLAGNRVIRNKGERISVNDLACYLANNSEPNVDQAPLQPAELGAKPPWGEIERLE